MSYQILSELGSGSFGVVYHLKLPNRREYALKVIEISSSLKEALTEAKIMVQLEHPHILQCCCVGTLRPGALFLLLEYCERGTLTDAIKKHVLEEQAITWFIQMAAALKYLHSNKVMHRDIKPDNILLDKDNNIKIGDLGIARIQEFTAQGGGTFAGTSCYMSPQILQGHPYKDKTDVWSLGCVFHEVLSKTPAFTNFSQILLGPTPGMPLSYSVELRTFVLTVLERDEYRRPSAEKVFVDLINLQGRPYYPRQHVRLQKEVVDPNSIRHALMAYNHTEIRSQATEASTSSNDGVSGWWLLGAGAVAAGFAALIAVSSTKESDNKKPKQ